MNFSLSPFRRPDTSAEPTAPVLMEPVLMETTPVPGTGRPAIPTSASTAVTKARVTAVRRASHLRYLQLSRLALLAAAVLAAFAMVTWIAGADALSAVEGSASWLRDRETMLRRTLVAIALLTLAALALVVAWNRATSLQRPIPLAGGRGAIEVGELASWLAATLEARPGVRTASVQIENRQPAGVRVDVRVRMDADAHIDETLDAVDDAAEELLTGRLGVAMDGPPLVDVLYDEFTLGSAS